MSYTLLFKTEDNNGLSVVIPDSTEALIPFHPREAVAYTPERLLEPGECFKIERFSEQDFCLDFLGKDKLFGIIDFPKWETSSQKIEYILNTDGRTFYFQKFVPSQIVRKNWLSIGGEPKLEKSGNLIVINPYAHAFYKKEEDILYFRKLDDLKKIFDGIEILYRDATQAEVDVFLSNSLFSIKDYDKDEMGILNLKRLASVKDKLGQVSDKKEFCQSLKLYCNDIQIQNGDTIVLKTDNDLKNVLYHLDERFYTTPISKEKRLANSIIKI